MIIQIRVVALAVRLQRMLVGGTLLVSILLLGHMLLQLRSQLKVPVAQAAPARQLQ